MIEILLRMTVGRKPDGGIRVVIDDEQPGAVTGLLRSIFGHSEPMPDAVVPVELTQKGIDELDRLEAERLKAEEAGKRGSGLPSPAPKWWPDSVKCTSCGDDIKLEKEPDCYAFICASCGAAVMAPPKMEKP